MIEEELLLEFIEWATDCGEDVFYIFEDPIEAIQKFLLQRNNGGN